MKKFILAVLLAGSACTMRAQGTQPTCNPFPKTINVSGSAEIEVIPDEIYVRVDLKEYKKKGNEKKEIEQIRSEFLSACKSVGIPDSNISVLNFEGENGNLMAKRRRKDPDMIATLSYQIKFSRTAKMNELVDNMDDEATSAFTVVRTSHSKATEYRKQLKIDAIRSAKAKATYLCEAINEQLGQAITIEEPVEYNAPMPYAQMRVNALSNSAYAEADAVAAEPQIDFKKVKYRFEIRMVFAIR